MPPSNSSSPSPAHARMPLRVPSGRAVRIVAVAMLSLVLVTVLGWALVGARVIQPNLLLVGDGTRGVDLSEDQGEVDFQAMRDAGIEFAYLMATEGSSKVDGQFARSWEEADAIDMPVGACHRLSFMMSGEAQAQHFIDTVGGMGSHMIPAVEVDPHADGDGTLPTQETLSETLKEFIEIVEVDCGSKPIIRVTRDAYDEYGLSSEFGDCDMWVSSTHWPVGMEWGRDVPWTIWQYGVRGRVPNADGEAGDAGLDVLAEDRTVASLMVPVG